MAFFYLFIKQKSYGKFLAHTVEAVESSVNIVSWHFLAVLKVL